MSRLNQNKRILLLKLTLFIKLDAKQPYINEKLSLRSSLQRYKEFPCYSRIISFIGENSAFQELTLLNLRGKKSRIVSTSEQMGPKELKIKFQHSPESHRCPLLRSRTLSTMQDVNSERSRPTQSSISLLWLPAFPTYTEAVSLARWPHLCLIISTIVLHLTLALNQKCLP